MSNKKWLILMIVAVLGSCNASWFARGLYDELMFYKGYVHLINGTKEQKNIELIFPSGESRKANIHPGKSRTFLVLNTGEGSITVNLDGQFIDQVGYVVFLNSPIAIVAMEDRAIFTFISIQR